MYGDIDNQLWENGVEKARKNIDYDKEKAFYTVDATPVQTVSANWRDFCDPDKGFDQ